MAFAELSVMVCDCTVIVPVAVAGLHAEPLVVIVYGYDPATVGVPLIVTAVPASDKETPAGKPVAVAPVAEPPSVKPILTGTFTHADGELLPVLRLIVCACTFIVPVALVGLHVPVVVTV